MTRLAGGTGAPLVTAAGPSLQAPALDAAEEVTGSVETTATTPAATVTPEATATPEATPTPMPQPTVYLETDDGLRLLARQTVIIAQVQLADQHRLVAVLGNDNGGIQRRGGPAPERRLYGLCEGGGPGRLFV